jgi:hypothetical protein
MKYWIAGLSNPAMFACMKAHPLWRMTPLLPLFLASCVFTAFYRTPRQVAFNEADLAIYAGSGTACVTGHLICTYEGEDHPGQRTPVTLLPVTSYTKEMIDRELGDGVTLVPSDPRLKKYVRITKTDDQGHFAFRDIPAGEYFVAGEATWEPAGGGDYLGQWACERITVHRGQMVNIRVTHNPQQGNSPINNIFTVE